MNQMTPNQALRAVLRDTWTLIKRQPWLGMLPVSAVWFICTTPKERDELVRRTLDEGYDMAALLEEIAARHR